MTREVLPESSQHAQEVLNTVQFISHELERRGFEPVEYDDLIEELGEKIKRNTKPRQREGDEMITTEIDQNIAPTEDYKLTHVVYEDESGNVKHDQVLLALDAEGWGIAYGEAPESWWSYGMKGEDVNIDFTDSNGNLATFGFNESNSSDQSVLFRYKDFMDESDYKVTSTGIEERAEEAAKHLGFGNENWFDFHEEAGDLLVRADLSEAENDREMRGRIDAVERYVEYLE